VASQCGPEEFSDALNTEKGSLIPGVWAIGDICNTSFSLAVVAAADGGIAAMSIDRYPNHRYAI
jgi:thioredoxin reductase (NADPH)